MKILNKYFQSNMILQAKVSQKIFGTLKTTKPIEIRLSSNDKVIETKQTTPNAQGDFEVYLDVYHPSYKSYTLSVYVENINYEVIENIVFGDVYLLAGQSNIAFQIMYTEDKKIFGDLDILKHDIRTCFLNDHPDESGYVKRPKNALAEVKNPIWSTLQKMENSKHISAIGLLLAIKLSHHFKYPIGLIITAVGGSSIDSWLSKDVILKNKDLHNYLLDTNKFVLPHDNEVLSIESYTRTSGIYNEKIAPLRHIRFNSLIWYQGENSVKDEASATYYKQALDTLIKSYRNFFNDEFLFIAIQITNHNYHYADYYAVSLINEAIKEACLTNENTRYIPVHDHIVRWYDDLLHEDSNPIHPINKSFIADRIFKTILYGDITPKVHQINYKDHMIEVELSNIFNQLNYRNPLIGFSVAGEDKVFHNAQAIIKDNKIYVSSKHVNKPIYINYGMYLYNHDLSIKNAYDIPLAPFRSHKLSLQESQYYGHQKYFTLESNEAYVNYFSPLFGFSELKPLYTTHMTNQLKDVHLSFVQKDNNNELHLEHKNTKHRLAYFGFMPIINYPGYIKQFHQYDYISVDIKMLEGHYTQFKGILLESKGQRFLLKNEKALTSKYDKFTFSLKSGLTNDLTPINLSEDILKHIEKLEFLFQDKNDGKLSLKSFEIHN